MLSWLGVLQVWQIYVLALLAGALSPATGAGVRVILPHLVADDELERANALASISLQLTWLLGPALAGMVITRVGGAFALVIDAVSFLLDDCGGTPWGIDGWVPSAIPPSCAGDWSFWHSLYPGRRRRRTRLTDDARSGRKGDTRPGKEEGGKLVLLVVFLPSMNADFFLPGIAPGFAGVGYPLISCFLHPGAHFILVLIEPVATKDLAPGESPGCRLHEPLPNLWIICSLGMPPRCLQRVAWIMNPWWASDVIAFAQKLDGGGAKRTPAVGKLGVLHWLGEWITH